MDNTRNSIPPLRIDPAQFSDRLTALATIPPCPECGPAVATAATGAAVFLRELSRVYSALIAARLQSANRLAAIRAALGAVADGEPDPWQFLRDELTDTTHHSPGSVEDGGWWA